MRRYFRVMLGAKSIHSNECYKGGFIGADFTINIDLSKDLSENWRDFNKKLIPEWMNNHPGKSKIAAGLACGMLWTISKGIKIGDTVFCPDGSGNYYVGEIVDNYSFHPNSILPHRRTVRWYDGLVERAEMSEELRNSAGSIGTVSEITKYASEIEKLIRGGAPQAIVANDQTIEDPTVFALEKHLEDFLVQNWRQTELGATYNIYEEDGELVGQQFPTDTGSIDILAVSKDEKTLLVVELKKGRASDNVVGQIQRYMGYVKEELAEKYQEVKGIIIALDDDIKMRRALTVTQNIDFYRYQVSFKLYKG